jgi:hypothetical protein
LYDIAAGYRRDGLRWLHEHGQPSSVLAASWIAARMRT